MWKGYYDRVEELQQRFGANLRLLDRERHGVRIVEEEVGNCLVGHRFTLVAKEVAEKRFLVRFANQRGVFCIQLQGIPPLNMTGAAVKKIGGLLTSVLELDQVDREDCVGRFARVRVRMDIEQPLMRGAFVEFLEEGSKWISFCYEYFPEYCFFYPFGTS
ncbi:hypothetical protein L3X38_037087 [Prunus dulcis]|uniref:Uncharacterized protein n=1 Tax=Prunus dulcis TaxID=3755 RepID=A0AAD4YQB5_PRUDU|nr:hypothetical protein L3X38_037087 [Prunus dulcis]